MEMRTCATCGGHWVNEQFHWATGKEGSELDLSGLVCNRLAAEKTCINPCRGMTGGATWEKREQQLNSLLMEL
jgi:hypothetical protein